jgi:bifunctional non-homologous end joining protein LigD
MILDRELVCLDSEGRPDFAAVRNRLGRGRVRSAAVAAASAPVTTIALEVLHLDARPVRCLPYVARREILLGLELDRGAIRRAPRHFTDDVDAVMPATAELGLEGVVAKRLELTLT